MDSIVFKKIIIISTMFIVNVLYYALANRKSRCDMFMKIHFFSRNLLIIFLLFRYNHWPFYEHLLTLIYLIVLPVFLIDVFRLISSRSKFHPYYWIDNTFNFILLLGWLNNGGNG